MCDYGVVTGAVVSAIATAVSTYATMQQMDAQEEAQKSQAKYAMQQAENEQQLQMTQAQMEQQKGENERTRQQRIAAQQQAEAASMLGASGFALDSGSIMSLLSDSAEEAQHDSNIITQGANMASWQHLVGAKNAENQRDMYNFQYKNAGANKSALYAGVGSSILGGIASGVSTYNNMPNKPKSDLTNSNPWSTGLNSYWSKGLLK